ncbi:MAG: dihydropteroate synthase [Nitrospiraceae bacterium]|nr:dihydropteroate synthase [Nitrospiraceae bacterium]
MMPIGPKVLIMGILNVTPDSFSEAGHCLKPETAIERAQQMIAEGADLIDIGGESTRPGASYVDRDEEIRRIAPILRVLRKLTNIPISIDTRKAAVARTALDLGADIINDVSALQDDPQMAQLIQETGAGVVLMHRQGHSLNMQHAPQYKDVVVEIKDFLSERISMARSVGIPADHIMVDPGIGFGKTLDHNLEILRNIGKFLPMGYPILIGVSRKAFIGTLTGKPVGKREFGNAAAVAAAVWQGAHIVRVHEVGAMHDAIQVAQALQKLCDK